MQRRLARPALVGVLAAAFTLFPATAAWAPHVPQLQVTPSQVQPGQEVTVVGTRGFGFTNPVEVRWNGVDGPILGSFQPINEPYAPWGPGTVRIPENVKAGTYYLWATQVISPIEKHIRGVPTRALVQVLGPGGVPALGAEFTTPGEVGTPGYTTEEGPSVWSLAFVGLGVAGLALLGAGAMYVAASKRSAKPAAGGAAAAQPSGKRS
ncbi:MAG: hypothetical protein ACRD2W_09430 [Acidimicrobiales bacterium]